MSRNRRCCCCQRFYTRGAPESEGKYIEIEGKQNFSYINNAAHRIAGGRLCVDMRNELVLFTTLFVPGRVDFCDLNFQNRRPGWTLLHAPFASGSVDVFTGTFFYCSNSVGGAQSWVSRIGYDGSFSLDIHTETELDANDSVQFLENDYCPLNDSLYYIRQYSFVNPDNTFERDERTINRVRSDGLFNQTIYTAGTKADQNGKQNANIIRSIAIDNTNGYVWWTEHERVQPSAHYLRRCALDGSGVETLAASESNYYGGIAWSHSLKRVFWMQYGIVQQPAPNTMPNAGLDADNGLFSDNFQGTDRRLELSRLAKNDAGFTSGWSGVAFGSSEINNIQLGCGLEDKGGNYPRF